VLDFGAANHSLATKDVAGSSTHDLVARHAESVVAVDVMPFQDPPHTQCRYVTADLLVESEWVRSAIEPVQVFFAGHVIEHLDAPGLMFELAARALAPDGILVIATPNPLWLPGLWARAAYRNLSVNIDHVALFGASELTELGERHGFDLDEWRYAGRGDMPEFVEVDGPFRRVVAWAYRFTRSRDMAFAHNHVVAAFTRAL
jgi:SAM-dependent methyltransferase